MTSIVQRISYLTCHMVHNAIFLRSNSVIRLSNVGYTSDLKLSVMGLIVLRITRNNYISQSISVCNHSNLNIKQEMSQSLWNANFGKRYNLQRSAQNETKSVLYSQNDTESGRYSQKETGDWENTPIYTWRKWVWRPLLQHPCQEPPPFAIKYKPYGISSMRLCPRLNHFTVVLWIWIEMFSIWA